MYYKVNMAIPFLNHIVAEIASKFEGLSSTRQDLLCLVPSVIASGQTNMDVSHLIATYEHDLPCPSLVQEEVYGWKLQYSPSSSEKELPDSSAKAIKACDRLSFPNIHMLLKIACTIPVTSYECERSFSVMRRLNNYVRCSMGDERLSALALMHNHYDKRVSSEETTFLHKFTQGDFS